MNPMNPQQRHRLLELLTDERLGGLDPADAGELEALRVQGEASGELDLVMGELLVAFDRDEPGDAIPQALRDRLIDRGTRLVANDPLPLPQASQPRTRFLAFSLIAASLLLVGTLTVSGILLNNRTSELDASRANIAQLEEQINANQMLLTSAQLRVESMQAMLADRDQSVTEAERALAAASAREVELAMQLAQATDDLSSAQLTIARYETPVDPAELQANRTKLLDMPDTVRIAWAPFDLPDAPAEQRNVTGDVVWNDELETGYLRFVGLKANDPNIEQYQVWVIDERGLEQKVSGGVFNATADGEVIVPIQPGIDVRRVALFAITIEEPGGTWVPDLERRVVVAPRDG